MFDTEKFKLTSGLLIKHFTLKVSRRDTFSKPRNNIAETCKTTQQ